MDTDTDDLKVTVIQLSPNVVISGGYLRLGLWDTFKADDIIIIGLPDKVKSFEERIKKGNPWLPEDAAAHSA